METFGGKLTHLPAMAVGQSEFDRVSHLSRFRGTIESTRRKGQLKNVKGKTGKQILTLYRKMGIKFPGITEFRDAHYFHRGTWYHYPSDLPCIFFDANGYVIMETAAQLAENFDTGVNVHPLPRGSGISTLPGYKKIDPPPSSFC